MKALAILTLALGAACSGGRSLLLVEVSLAEPGLKPSTVEVTATPSAGSPVTRTFDWSEARSDVLSAGIFLPADVEGAVMVRAAGMDAGGGLVATGTATVEKGKASAPVALALRRVRAPIPDGGAPMPDGGSPMPDGAVPGPEAGVDAPPGSDLAADTTAPVDLPPVEPPTLTKCQVYEHAGPCTITPAVDGVGVWDLRFSPDGNYLVTGGDDGKAKIWKVMPGGLVDESRVLDTGSRGSGVHMAFSRDSTRMALGGGNGTIAIYEFPKGSMVTQLIGHANGIGELAFSADGTRVVSVDHMGTVKVWDLATSKEVKTFVLPGEYGIAVLSPAGQPGSLWLAANFTQMKGVLLADLAANPVATVRFDTPMNAYGMAFSPDGRSLAIANEDGSMNLWDVSDKQKPVMGPVLWPMDNELTTMAVFSPDGRFVAGSCSGGMYTPGELKMASIQPVGLRGSNATMSSAMSIDFSPDGRAVAAGSWRCGKITYCKD